MKQESKKPGARVLVVGGGGRCHAIVDALARSPRVGKIYCAPGNAGIAAMAECVAIAADDVERLADFAASNAIDLTVVGPEAALAAGIADHFAGRGLKLFGPTRAATRIESSKEFAKDLMQRHDIPTARWRAFDDFKAAEAYVHEHGAPIVVKYDGLAAGKGVVVALTEKEAVEALRSMLLDDAFGKGRVIIEDFLDGPEFSFLCLVNGSKVYPLELSQDHKRAFDGDRGPNTGGMGAYSPVPFIPEEMRQRALHEIMEPVARALEAEGAPFLGILYGGLILTADGPKVIEFNARFGDPETEVVLPRLQSDFYNFVEAVMEGRDFTPQWSPEAALGIVLAAEGYPGSYRRNIPLGSLEAKEGQLFHMGTHAGADDTYLSAGGRVLMAVGRGATLKEASMQAHRLAQSVCVPGLFHRNDIGHAALGDPDRAHIIDGKRMATEIKRSLAATVAAKIREGNREPNLTVILVGDDPSSVSYVASKAKACVEVGIRNTTLRLPADISRDELWAEIDRLNADPTVDGILIQLPMPRHIRKRQTLARLDPSKDVDGFTPTNVAAMWQKLPCLEACTPKGIITMLERSGVKIEGSNAVVVGRSSLVGYPVSKMLLDRHATVTVAHSHTRDLGELTRRAEILVVAIGKARIIKGDMVKPGATVIDVGISRDPATGKFVGDVDFDEAVKVAGMITPVPGGVGPMTIASLMQNTVECYLRHINPDPDYPYNV